MKKFFSNVLAVIVGNILTITIIGFFVSLLIFFLTAGSLFDSKKLYDGSVLEITLNSPIKESSMDDEFSLFDDPSEFKLYLKDIIHSVNAAADDDKIKGISLRVQNFSGGSSQLSDIRDALVDFKKSGKFIYAYSHNSTQGSYVLNSVADSIFQNPLGMVLFQGMSAEVMFYKNFGDKYGVDFQVIRHGAYKSAVEPYLRDDLSEENREQLSLLLGDIWQDISSKVADSRNITQEQLNVYADSLFSFNPEKALKYKLVDKISAEPEYEMALMSRLGLDVKEDGKYEEELKKYTVSLDDYAASLKTETSKDQIAVLYALGAITSGDGYSGIQSEVYKKAIRDLRDDDKVKAVVLRINSPGGSADAAEEILFELRQLHKKKPIIVSFGDVAASGGYYIAMESDSIFASPNTITGSIGVLGMIPNVKGMINNIGITTDYVRTNENSDFLKSLFQPMTQSGIQAMTDMTEGVYKIFVSHVMNGRKMTFEEVDKIGGGRVWSGTQALKIGLIDSFGTLDDAIEAAAAKASLNKYSVKSYPFKKNDLNTFLENFGSVKSEVFIEQELGSDYYNIYMDLKAMREYNGIQLRMPFMINIK